jgi:hypothetical protein
VIERSLYRAVPISGLLLAVLATVIVLSHGAGSSYAQSDCIWSGTWDTSWPTGHAIMELTQNGTHVVGSYDHDNGRIAGSIQGSVLTGTWSESPTYSPSEDAGDVEFSIAPNCLTFTGRFRFGSAGDWTVWNGTRRGPAPTVAVAASPTPAATTAAATVPATIAATMAAGGGASGSWLNGPRGSAVCPASGQWLLLYWGGADQVSVATTATRCSGADRIWANRDGRWLGYAEGSPAASDSWTVAAGEAAFLHGK